MSYFDGFLVPCPTANREAYRAQAEAAWPMFNRLGAQRMVEGWGDDVPRGEVNDLYGAVQATADETVLFSWVEYADKAARGAAHAAMHADPAMQAMPEMPFDGKRMFWSGFEVLHEAGAGGGRPGYVDGVVIPVPVAKKDAYRDFCVSAGAAMLEAGATRVVDGWGDELMEGKVTDFHRAVMRREDEAVVFGWIEWPDKASRDAGWERLMQDGRLMPADRPFDGKRMIFGGFAPIVDVR